MAKIDNLPYTREEITAWKLSLNLDNSRTLMSLTYRGDIGLSGSDIIYWANHIRKKFPDLITYKPYFQSKRCKILCIADVPVKYEQSENFYETTRN